jgi:hypothetical protein
MEFAISTSLTVLSALATTGPVRILLLLFGFALMILSAIHGTRRFVRAHRKELVNDAMHDAARERADLEEHARLQQDRKHTQLLARERERRDREAQESRYRDWLFTEEGSLMLVASQKDRGMPYPSLDYYVARFESSSGERAPDTAVLPTPIDEATCPGRDGVTTDRPEGTRPRNEAQREVT